MCHLRFIKKYINNDYIMHLNLQNQKKKRFFFKSHCHRYTNNVKNRQKVFHDNQVKPLDVAVYWTEYVLRHKGAPHLRSEAALELRWYQHILLDVVLFLFTIFTLTISAFYYIIKYILNKRKSKKMKQQ